jgi:D-tyrosyl-tRNA(Tyr) deacylase
MKSIPAQELYNQFLDLLKSNYQPDKIKDGVFGAMMDVALVNDGPVTIIIESDISSKTLSRSSSTTAGATSCSSSGEEDDGDDTIEISTPKS